MSDLATKRMIRAYIQEASVLMFLAGFFASPSENFYNGEFVELDIERSGEDVAVVVHDISAGYRRNADDVYTNKEFKAPVYKEASTINSYELIKRSIGEEPFKDPAYRANLIRRSFKIFRKMEKKIRRAIELQASQILQTGGLILQDYDGNNLYELNFQPKPTHFPTVGVAWSDHANADPIADLASLAEEIRNNGLMDCDKVLMGDGAYGNFICNEKVQKLMDNRRIDIGSIGRSAPRGNGGTYRGSIDVDNYKFEIFTYGGRYVDPETKATLRYLDKDKVVMMSEGTRLDATFGGIPNIGKLLGLQADSVLPELPGRIDNTEGGMGLHTNAWVTDDGEDLFVGVGSRPLLIPTAIDTYGCLTTEIV